jgi:hypothetical protein
MFRRVAYLAAAAGVLSLLAGCAFNFMGEQRASWREQAEAVCMTGHAFASSPFIVPAKEVDGRGSCGITYPLRVSAFSEGSVAVGPNATLGCPLVDAVERWLRESVQPAAIAWYGAPVVAIRQISDYSCRSRNSIHGARLSEHAFGNALDVAGFVFEDGSEVTVKAGWRGSARDRGFLREVEATACQRFTTVLGPGAPYHGDHFHVDLARHGSARISRYCNPTPQVVPPVRAPYVPSRVAGLPPRVPAFASGVPPAYDPFGVDTMRSRKRLSYSGSD